MRVRINRLIKRYGAGPVAMVWGLLGIWIISHSVWLGAEYGMPPVTGACLFITAVVIQAVGLIWIFEANHDDA